MNGWLIEPHGTEGYAVGRIGGSVDILVLPGGDMEMDDATAGVVRAVAERIRDMLNGGGRLPTGEGDWARGHAERCGFRRGALCNCGVR